jgi:hypothetical protein
MPGVTLDATLNETPRRSSDSPGFPSASTSIPFGLNGCPDKPVCASTGRILRQLNSPSAFVTLDGVGASDVVTMAATVYARVRCGGFQLRVTMHNPLGSPIVSVVPFAGVFLFEPDVANGYYVTLLELQGVGAVEYYASGQS